MIIAKENKLSEFNFLINYMDLSENVIFLRNEVENHDLSKLSEREFFQYQKHFYPTSKEELDSNKNKEMFLLAFKHHYINNRHHWQGRSLRKYDPPYEKRVADVIHNVIDWVAMSKKFNVEIDNYYINNKHKMELSEDDIRIIELVFKLFKTVYYK